MSCRRTIRAGRARDWPRKGMDSPCSATRSIVSCEDGDAMPFTPEEIEASRSLASMALEEDLGAAGDLTSLALVPTERIGTAVLIARQPGILAGLPVAELTFALVDPKLLFE